MYEYENESQCENTWLTRLHRCVSGMCNQEHSHAPGCTSTVTGNCDIKLKDKAFNCTCFLTQAGNAKNHPQSCGLYRVTLTLSFKSQMEFSRLLVLLSKMCSKICFTIWQKLLCILGALTFLIRHNGTN